MCGIGLRLQLNGLEGSLQHIIDELNALGEMNLGAEDEEGNDVREETTRENTGTETLQEPQLTPSELMERCIPLIKERGPSDFQHLSLESDSNFEWHMDCFSSVLALRGNHVARQPRVDKCLSQTRILMWNGEYYGPEELSPESNDTEYVASSLLELDSSQEVAQFMASIQGEYAFVYIMMDSNTQQMDIIFGRDPRGRRSLLWECIEDNILISSVGLTHPVDTRGLYVLSLHQDQGVQIHCVHWNSILPENHPQMLLQTTHTTPTEDTEDFSTHCKQFYESLKCAVRRRVCNIHDPQQTLCELGVLFSGGIDSVIITALAAQVLHPDHIIELMNISFSGNTSADRKQAIRAYNELKKVYPEREFRLVLSDISREELTEHQDKIIALISPRDTVIDFNIGASFYFAARGEGYLYERNDCPYTAKCRVLLNGIGSDEYLAGYRRHRAAFLKGGPERLLQELKMDQDRLWIRNLGRDDRVISSSGRECRMPFLDEAFLFTVLSIPLHHLCDMERKSGEGDKRILRVVAREHCNLEQTAYFVKRAVQFGSGIAKISFKKQHADTKIASVLCRDEKDGRP